MKLWFESRSVKIDELNGIKILSAKPDSKGNLFVFLEDASLAHICFESRKLTQMSDLSNHNFPLSSSFEIHCTDDNKFVALTCTHRGDEQSPPLSAGIVVSVDNLKEIMTLSNGDYHTEQTPFPACFVTHGDRNLLVHATDWNRLDITDLETGQILTERDYAEKPDLSDHDDFVFTEWPGKLLPSPSQSRIATIGWVWHPIGQAYSFDLKRWIEGHKWESDTSVYQKSYAIWDYFWDSPFTWLDDCRLCIWGVDEDSLEPTDSATIFNAKTGEKLLSFDGPTMETFFYDKYLFSGIKENSKHRGGLSVWDVNNGDLLHVEPGFTFDSYCYGTHEFFKFEESGHITISKWHSDE